MEAQWEVLINKKCKPYKPYFLFYLNICPYEEKKKWLFYKAPGI